MKRKSLILILSVILAFSMAGVGSFYFLLKNSPEVFLPSRIARLVKGGTASYNPLEGSFRIHDLILQDMQNKFLLKLPFIQIDFYLLDLIRDHKKIRIRRFYLNKPEVVFINRDEPIREKNVVEIREGIPVFIQKNFPGVILDSIKVEEGFLDFIDLPGKSHRTVIHRVRAVDLELGGCAIHDLSQCHGELSFDLGTDSSRYPVSHFKAKLLKDPDTPLRSRFEFQSEKPLHLQPYDLYLGSRGYRILSGLAYLYGVWNISEKEIVYKNRVTLVKLGLEDKREGTRAYLRNLLLPAYLNYISDDSDEIRVQSSGKAGFGKGTKHALRKIKQDLLKGVEAKLVDY